MLEETKTAFEGLSGCVLYHASDKDPIVGGPLRVSVISALKRAVSPQRRTQRAAEKKNFDHRPDFA
jgi:hypothetical protein